MSERKGIVGKLKQAQDSIAEGNLPDKTVMKELELAYGNAINESKCPCGVLSVEGRNEKYAECCKREYQAAVRGVKGLKREQASTPEEEATEEAENEPEQDVKWCCRIGVSKTGEPVTDVTGMAFDDEKISPQRIAGLLLSAYHDLMTSGAFMLANGVYNRVMTDIGAVQAKARRKGRPANRPVK